MKNFVTTFFGTIFGFFVTVKKDVDTFFSVADAKVLQAHTVTIAVADKVTKFKNKASAAIWGIWVFLRTVGKIFAGLLVIIWRIVFAILKFLYKRGKAVLIVAGLAVIAIVFGKIHTGNSSKAKTDLVKATDTLKKQAETVNQDVAVAQSEVKAATADVVKTGAALDDIAKATTTEQKALAEDAGFTKA
jgi:outer membrane murein-binding lipoprotein Lpp